MPVELGVDQHPALFARIPVLAHPVIDVLARLKVVGEADACARRDALPAQDRDEERGEVATDADDAAIR